MFAKTVTTVALTAMIGLGAAAATTAPAAAGGIDVDIYLGGPGFGVGYGPGPWGPGYGPKGGKCKNFKAVNKAYKVGVYNGHVVKKTPYKVVVKGWKFGHPRKVVFANNWKCPILAVY